MDQQQPIWFCYDSFNWASTFADKNFSFVVMDNNPFSPFLSEFLILFYPLSFETLKNNDKSVSHMKHYQIV